MTLKIFSNSWFIEVFCSSHMLHFHPSLNWDKKYAIVLSVRDILCNKKIKVINSSYFQEEEIDIKPSIPEDIKEEDNIKEDGNDKKLIQNKKTCSRCGRNFTTFGQYMVHYHLRHFPNRKSQRINSKEMFEERLGYPEL